MNSGATEKKTITRFLIVGFAGLVVFSVIAFAILGVYTSKKSAEAVYDVGSMYMEGIGQQLSSHFETTIELRFGQMEGLAEVVSGDNMEIPELYAELEYRAKIRNFDYLALCSSTGVFETIYGEEIHPVRPEPFLTALNHDERRVVIGKDAKNKDVILFGIAASYPMSSGETCTGLVGAVPIEYITNTISLNSEETLFYCHIIRTDGTFVIDSLNRNDPDYFSCIRNRCESDGIDADSAKTYLAMLSDALGERKSFSYSLEINGSHQQIYGTSMPYSEWYLLMVMPYGSLDRTLETLGGDRTAVIFMTCGGVILLLTLVFGMYYKMTHKQVAELEQARAEAVKAGRAKSEFLSNMSHDIRTPMNAVVGMTTVALSNIDDKDYVQNCLKKIDISSKHLLGLINDVLDMSKIESGKMTLSSSQVSLKEIVEEIVSIIQPQVKAKNQNFEVHIDKIETEEIVCDNVRLNQVLINLMSNAVKFTPEGGTIRLAISESESPKGEQYVRIYISVKDNGIGMTPEFLAQIYEAYSRADSARVHKTEGAGLGMAITKYIVDAMGGTIDVQSEPNKGTEFLLTLDFEKVPAAEVDMQLPDVSILVVDDDELLCRTVSESLKTLGTHAEWTLSGEDAFRLICRHHEEGEDYQVILLDWKLPELDGVRTAKMIRDRLGQEVPILLISAYDWSEFEAEARAAGINGFISKPLFKSTLYYGLKAYLEPEQSTVATQKPEGALAGRRILIAEDNELNWEVARELLSDFSVELEWAENGEICVDKFKNAPAGYYDAILMDIRMPVMNGYEATRTIRSLDHSDAKTIPIIAMTADAFAEDIKSSLDAGMNAHIAKPIDIQEVTHVLEKFLKKEH